MIINMTITRANLPSNANNKETTAKGTITIEIKVITRSMNDKDDIEGE